MDIPAVITTVQSQFTDLVAVYLFGSMIGNRQNADSDIDLAFLTLGKNDRNTCWAVAQTLAAQLDKDVDLVDLKEATTVLNFQVLTEGRRIWRAEQEAYYVENYENSIYSQYQHLQAERKDIVEQFKQRYKALK